MARQQTRTERMTEETAEAIKKHCYGSVSGFWRRHLIDSGISLPVFSSALKRDPADPAVISAILAATEEAYTERPLSEICIGKPEDKE